MTAHRFCQLAAFIIPHIAGRGADQAGHRVLLHVFAHVNADHVLHIVKQHFRQRLGQLGLAYAGRSQEDEGADGTVGVLDARTGTDHSIRHGFHRFILADDMLMEGCFQMYQFLPFPGTQTLYRNAGPGADYPGDVVLVHFFFQQGIIAAGLFFQFLQLFLQFRQAAILQFRQFVQVIVPLRLFHFLLHGTNLFFHFPYLDDAGLFIIPALDQGRVFLPQFGQLLLQFGQAVRRSRVFFFFQGLLFNFQL